MSSAKSPILLLFTALAEDLFPFQPTLPQAPQVQVRNPKLSVSQIMLFPSLFFMYFLTYYHLSPLFAPKQLLRSFFKYPSQHGVRVTLSSNPALPSHLPVCC